VNEATNTISRTPESRCVEVTAPNGSGRNRGRTLDCSALTPGTKLIMHRATEEQAQSECEWKRGKGV
jgi:hypothetical protein